MSMDIQKLQQINKERLASIEGDILPMVINIAKDVEALIAATPDNVEELNYDEHIADDLECLFNGEVVNTNPYSEAANMKDRYRYILTLCKDDVKLDEVLRPITRRLIAHWSGAQILTFDEIYDDPDMALQEEIAGALDDALDVLDYYKAATGSFAEIGKEGLGEDEQYDVADEIIEIAQNVLPFIHAQIVGRSSNQLQSSPDLDGSVAVDFSL